MTGVPEVIILFLYIGLLLVILLGYLAGLAKIYSKAGEPWWGVIIPIYSQYLMCRVANKPGWWTILLLIPLFQIVFSLPVIIDIAKNFGKGLTFGFAMWLLPFIFFPILGFGDATYEGISYAVRRAPTSTHQQQEITEKRGKTDEEKYRELIANLEERLASGEISEETYAQLKEKYEKKLEALEGER